MIRSVDPGLDLGFAFREVTSLDEAIDEVRRLGGTVLHPKKAVQKVGHFVFVADAEGKMSVLWQSGVTASPSFDF